MYWVVFVVVILPSKTTLYEMSGYFRHAINDPKIWLSPGKPSKHKKNYINCRYYIQVSTPLHYSVRGWKYKKIEFLKTSSQMK